MSTSASASTSTDLPYPCSLVVLKDNGLPSNTLSFHPTRAWYCLGAHDDCDVRIHATAIANLHAMVHVLPHAVVLHGLDPAFPVVIPRHKKAIRRGEQVLLNPNDVFILGRRKFRILFEPPTTSSSQSQSTHPSSHTSQSSQSSASTPPSPPSTPPARTRPARRRRNSLLVTATEDSIVTNVFDPSRMLPRLPPSVNPHSSSDAATAAATTAATATATATATPGPTSTPSRLTRSQARASETPSHPVNPDPTPPVKSSPAPTLSRPPSRPARPPVPSTPKRPTSAAARPPVTPARTPAAKSDAQTPHRMLTRSAAKKSQTLPAPSPDRPPLLNQAADGLTTSARRELVFSRLCDGLPATPLRGNSPKSKAVSPLSPLRKPEFSSQSRPVKQSASARKSPKKPKQTADAAAVDSVAEALAKTQLADDKSKSDEKLAEERSLTPPADQDASQALSDVAAANRSELEKAADGIPEVDKDGEQKTQEIEVKPTGVEDDDLPDAADVHADSGTPQADVSTNDSHTLGEPLEDNVQVEASEDVTDDTPKVVPDLPLRSEPSSMPDDADGSVEEEDQGDSESLVDENDNEMESRGVIQDPSEAPAQSGDVELISAKLESLAVEKDVTITEDKLVAGVDETNLRRVVSQVHEIEAQLETIQIEETVVGDEVKISSAAGTEEKMVEPESQTSAPEQTSDTVLNDDNEPSDSDLIGQNDESVECLYDDIPGGDSGLIEPESKTPLDGTEFAADDVNMEEEETAHEEENIPEPEAQTEALPESTASDAPDEVVPCEPEPIESSSVKEEPEATRDIDFEPLTTEPVAAETVEESATEEEATDVTRDVDSELPSIVPASSEAEEESAVEGKASDVTSDIDVEPTIAASTATEAREESAVEEAVDTTRDIDEEPAIIETTALHTSDEGALDTATQEHLEESEVVAEDASEIAVEEPAKDDNTAMDLDEPPVNSVENMETDVGLEEASQVEASAEPAAESGISLAIEDAEDGAGTGMGNVDVVEKSVPLEDNESNENESMEDSAPIPSSEMASDATAMESVEKVVNDPVDNVAQDVSISETNSTENGQGESDSAEAPVVQVESVDRDGGDVIVQEESSELSTVAGREAEVSHDGSEMQPADESGPISSTVNDCSVLETADPAPPHAADDTTAASVSIEDGEPQITTGSNESFENSAPEVLPSSMVTESESQAFDSSHIPEMQTTTEQKSDACENETRAEVEDHDAMEGTEQQVTDMEDGDADVRVADEVMDMEVTSSPDPQAVDNEGESAEQSIEGQGDAENQILEEQPMVESEVLVGEISSKDLESGAAADTDMAEATDAETNECEGEARDGSIAQGEDGEKEVDIINASDDDAVSNGTKPEEMDDSIHDEEMKEGGAMESVDEDVKDQRLEGMVDGPTEATISVEVEPVNEEIEAEPDTPEELAADVAAENSVEECGTPTNATETMVLVDNNDEGEVIPSETTPTNATETIVLVDNMDEGEGSPTETVLKPCAASYEKKTVKELRVILKERGLPSGGLKRELIARLMESDGVEAEVLESTLEVLASKKKSGKNGNADTPARRSTRLSRRWKEMEEELEQDLDVQRGGSRDDEGVDEVKRDVFNVGVEAEEEEEEEEEKEAVTEDVSAEEKDEPSQGEAVGDDMEGAEMRDGDDEAVATDEAVVEDDCDDEEDSVAAEEKAGDPSETALTEEEASKFLHNFTVKELRKMCSEKGSEAPTRARKREIVELLISLEINADDKSMAKEGVINEEYRKRVDMEEEEDEEEYEEYEDDK